MDATGPIRSHILPYQTVVDVATPHQHASTIASGVFFQDRTADGGGSAAPEIDTAAPDLGAVAAEDGPDDLNARRGVGLCTPGIGYATTVDAGVVLDQAIFDPDRDGGEGGIVVVESQQDAAVPVAGDGGGTYEKIADAGHLNDAGGVVLPQGDARTAGIRDDAIQDAGIDGAGIDAVGATASDDCVGDPKGGIGDDARGGVAVDAVGARVRDLAIVDGAVFAFNPISRGVADREAVEGSELQKDGIRSRGQRTAVEQDRFPSVQRGQHDLVGDAYGGQKGVGSIRYHDRISGCTGIDGILDVGGGCFPGGERGNMESVDRHETRSRGSSNRFPEPACSGQQGEDSPA